MTLCLLLVLVVFFPYTNAFPPGTELAKVIVVIRNEMDTNTSVAVHCKSKNDDLGIQTLQIGQSFRFKFRVNLFRTTLFFCNFQWESNGVIVTKWFDIYDAKNKDKRACVTCEWMIHERSVCRYRPPPQEFSCYHYNPNPIV